MRTSVLADGWYSWILPHESLTPLTTRIRGWPDWARRFLWEHGAARGLAIFLLGRRYDRVAVVRSDRGWRTLLLLQALLGRPRSLVALHFIEHPDRAGGAGRLIDCAWRPVDRWATRRALAEAQVLSLHEPDLYSERFGLPRERFRLIPFAWRLAPPGAPPPAPAEERSGIVVAGRAECDWETLFAAAGGRGWPLTVVCEARVRDELASLDARWRAGAEILCDLPHEDVRQRLRGAAVSVVPTTDTAWSHGHVRVCDATEAGAPLVASDVCVLSGYVRDGETALLVAPGDATALRDAIERLLADPALRQRLAGSAFERAGSWPWDRYLAAVDALVHGEAPPERGFPLAGL